MRRSLTIAAVLVLLPAVYLLAWPVDIEPVAWEAPPAPSMTGRYEPNSRLADVERLELAEGSGPEDVAIDDRGRAYGGLLDGRIVRFDSNSSSWESFVNTGGRPLGLDFDQSGNLIVADAFAGLLSVDANGEIEVLATEAGGKPFGLTDDVDVAADGLIYFTDASWRHPLDHYQLDVLEHRPYGRLLVHDREQGTTEVLLDGLHFANGVAVSPSSDFVLVNETWEYRVTRYWLSGPKAGDREVFIDNLPGFPDGISTGSGVFWVALASPRNALIDNAADKPWLRKVIARLPGWMQPDTVHYGFVLGIDVEGDVIWNLQDPDGRYSPITSVEEYGDTLFLGSLSDTAIGRWRLP